MSTRLHHALVRTATLLGALVLTLAVLAVAWWYECRRPNPEAIDREELFRWLVTYDLADVSPQTRWLLARRLGEEFPESFDWRSIADRLTAEHRSRLWANVPLLLEPWFMDKVDRYDRCDAQDRMAFLDRIIDTLSAWKGLDAIGPPANQAGAGPSDLRNVLFDQIDQWRIHAKPEQQQRIDQLVAAVEMRWLFRRLAGSIDAPETTAPEPEGGTP